MDPHINYVYRLSAEAIEALAYHLNQTQLQEKTSNEEDTFYTGLEGNKYKVIVNQSIAL